MKYTKGNTAAIAERCGRDSGSEGTFGVCPAAGAAGLANKTWSHRSASCRAAQLQVLEQENSTATENVIGQTMMLNGIEPNHYRSVTCHHGFEAVGSRCVHACFVDPPGTGPWEVRMGCGRSLYFWATGILKRRC